MSLHVVCGLLLNISIEFLISILYPDFYFLEVLFYSFTNLLILSSVFKGSLPFTEKHLYSVW